ncbi:MAG: TonB-dependent receptor, partial [Gammaproteobacteria bacterium]
MTNQNTRISEIFSRRLLCAAVCGALFAPLQAISQENEEREMLLEEVVVTAQRREQSLQEVPMSISAFTADDLEALQADNLDSLQGAVPNLNLVQGRGSNSSVNAFIRGIGQPDALQTFDPAVGIYLDDVNIARIQGAMFKLYDIERIEVLRGPQGTLYGKNTPGGAIRLITRNPGDELEIAARVVGGDYDRFQAGVYVGGPITDSFSLSVSALHDERDGFVTDPLDGRKYNDEFTDVFRVKGVWDASDDLEVVFSADYTSEDVALTLGRAEAPLFSFDLVNGFVPRYVPPAEEWNFEASTNIGDLGGQQTETWGTNLTLSWDASDALSFKSMTAYRELQSDLYIDIDATTLALGDVYVGIDQDQFSQEFQLLGDNGGDVTWVAGLYYLKENVPSNQEAYADDYILLNGLPVTFTRIIADDLTTTSYAAFAQVDWAFTDRWSLGLGMRYTLEEKDYSRTNSIFSNFPPLAADPVFAFTDSDDW